MIFGRFLSQPAPAMTSDRLYLRPPDASDFDQWATLRAVSRTHLQPWEPSWAEDSLTREGFRRRLNWFERLRRSDSGAAFFAFAANNNALLGGITLSNLRRGAAQCGELGYWIGRPYAGQGYMTEALAVITVWCFAELKLHRLEAATLPENQPSQRLLLRAGFKPEGLMRGYLKIDGTWRDHRLYARLVSDSAP